MGKWEKLKREEGTLYFRKHKTRKNGVKFDRYYRTEYKHNKQRVALNFGWASEGWTESACLQKLKYFKGNARAGKKPINFKQEREIQAEKEKREQKEKQKDITLSDFFYTHYIPIAEKSKKLASISNEKGFFKNWLKPETGHLSFDRIKPFNLEKVKKNMIDAGRAPRSVQHVFAIFRQIWNQARLQDITAENSPTLKVKVPKVDNKRLRFLTQDEANWLLSNLKERSMQLHNMALLSLHTGMRAGEIFSLTWGGINFKSDTITIKNSKSGKTRYVYMTNATRDMLQSLHADQEGSKLVFPDRNGKKIVAISNSFNRAVDELGLNQGVEDPRDKVLFHSLRHTFASWHVQGGTDLYTVKELLGHSTIQLTERYSHLRPDGLKQAARNFNRMAEGGQSNIISATNQL